MKPSEIAKHLTEVGLPAVASASAARFVSESDTRGVRMLPPLGLVASTAGITGVYGDRRSIVLICQGARLEFHRSQWRLLARLVGD